MAKTEKSPAFQFYVKDWRGDDKVSRLSLQAKGAYIDLLCLMWVNGTDGLADDPDIARRLGVTDECWSTIRGELQKPGDEVFVESDGRLVSRRLQKERRKQRQRSKKASDAAAKRWQCERIPLASPEQCTASSSAFASSTPEREEDAPAHTTAIRHCQSVYAIWKSQHADANTPNVWPRKRNGDGWTASVADILDNYGVGVFDSLTPAVLDAAYADSQNGAMFGPGKWRQHLTRPKPQEDHGGVSLDVIRQISGETT